MLTPSKRAVLAAPLRHGGHLQHSIHALPARQLQPPDNSAQQGNSSQVESVDQTCHANCTGPLWIASKLKTLCDNLRGHANTSSNNETKDQQACSIHRHHSPNSTNSTWGTQEARPYGIGKSQQTGQTERVSPLLLRSCGVQRWLAPWPHHANQ